LPLIRPPAVGPGRTPFRVSAARRSKARGSRWARRSGRRAGLDGAPAAGRGRRQGPRPRRRPGEHRGDPTIPARLQPSRWNDRDLAWAVRRDDGTAPRPGQPRVPVV